MTPEKQKQKLSGQTTIAQKIFQYVPVAEEWTPPQIGQAMTRACGSRTDPATIVACLRALVDAGLARATNRGTFQRVPVSQPAAPQPQKQEKEIKVMTAPTQPATKAATSAIDLLAGLAQKLRSVANDIDAAALPCIWCGIAGHSQHAHLNLGKGMGLKTDDRTGFPLCCTRPGIEGCHAAFDSYRLLPGGRDAHHAQGRAWAQQTRTRIYESGQWPKKVPLWQEGGSDAV